MKRIFLIFSVFLIIFGLGNFAFGQSDDKIVILETNLGNIVIEFFPEDAPNHVNSFIELTESGFYDQTLFHRICEGFMIQGGDPNTINGDPEDWGTGGPGTFLDAEFNTIKHKRGILSMARAAPVDSAGSQFFIMHQDNSHLNEKYTVFGRIITDESFDTLDKIANVETKIFKNPNEKCHPVEPEEVRIKQMYTVNRSDVSNILDLPEPERIQTPLPSPLGNQKFESAEHEISFSVPQGWLLQEPKKNNSNAPDVAAVGPKSGEINPTIYLIIEDTNEKTFEEIISERDATLLEGEEIGKLTIISQEKIVINDNQVYKTKTEEPFTINNATKTVIFYEHLIYDDEKYYRLIYGNGSNEFESQLPQYQESVDSFTILSTSEPNDKKEFKENDGGCLIATATFGSELSPQIQNLRELRDNVILSTSSGMAFMSGFNQIYYSFSPTVADMEREYPLFKEAVKLAIIPMISTLSILNYVEINSEQEILYYGISIILMNIGMYFVAPAIVISKIRKLI